MAISTSNGKRGKQLGILRTIQRAFMVLAPLVGGLLIKAYGYNAAFILGMILVLLSAVPLWFMPPYKVQYEFGYFETYKKVFSKKFRSMSLSMMSYGAENIVGAAVWPIFLFTIFNGDLLQVGGFAAFIVLLSLILELVVGKETDKVSPRKMLHIGTSIYAVGWLWKGLVQTVTGVFAASTFHSLGSPQQ